MYNTLSIIGIIMGILTPPIFIALMLYQIKLQRDAIKDKKITEKKIISTLWLKILKVSILSLLIFSIIWFVFFEEFTKLNTFFAIFNISLLSTYYTQNLIVEITMKSLDMFRSTQNSINSIKSIITGIVEIEQNHVNLSQKQASALISVQDEIDKLKQSTKK